MVKLEGNIEHPNTRGKLCAKGNSGFLHIYVPDRITQPLLRVGKRGEGKWKRISWEEALTELGGKLKELQNRGVPEKCMFHYGRMIGSSSIVVQKYFLRAYGTAT